MHNTADKTNKAWRPLRRFAPGAALLLISFAAAHGQSKGLPANTRFLIPEPPSGAVQQV